MGKKIKIGLNKSVTDEKGQAFILVLILLVLGSLIITPLLAYMSTGLIVGQMHVRMTHEAYAADAGVEDAMGQIKTEAAELPEVGDDPWQYEIADVNDKDVDVAIAHVDEHIYKITSVATSHSGESTTVESYVSIKTIFDYAIASKNDILLKQNTTVTGDIYFEGQFDPPADLVHDGDVVNGDEVWPSQQEDEQFAEKYKDEALLGGIHLGDKTIPAGPATTDLGPLYITGNLNIAKDNTIVLKGTIYVEGEIDMDKEADLSGAGAIVAVGDIYLGKVHDYPIEGSGTIMSLNGDITFKKEATLRGLIYAPKGTIMFDKAVTITGSVIGEDVQADKDSSFTYDETIGDRDSLPGSGALVIHTYTIE